MDHCSTVLLWCCGDTDTVGGGLRDRALSLGYNTCYHQPPTLRLLQCQQQNTNTHSPYMYPFQDSHQSGLFKTRIFISFEIQLEIVIKLKIAFEIIDLHTLIKETHVEDIHRS